MSMAGGRGGRLGTTLRDGGRPPARVTRDGSRPVLTAVSRLADQPGGRHRDALLFRGPDRTRSPCSAPIWSSSAGTGEPGWVFRFQVWDDHTREALRNLLSGKQAA